MFIIYKFFLPCLLSLSTFFLAYYFWCYLLLIALIKNKNHQCLFKTGLTMCWVIALFNMLNLLIYLKKWDINESCKDSVRFLLATF